MSSASQLTFAFVFARGGSKGLPRKNILPLQGIPLVGHSVLLARSMKQIDKVFVSTDCPEISSVSEEYGAIVIPRPYELATDSAPEWQAWQHAIQYVISSYGDFDCFLSLPTTAPLRNRDDIERCLQALTPSIDIVLTMTKSHRSPWFNMVKYNEDRSVSLINDSPSSISRRQDVPHSFDLTTVAYVTTPRFVLNNSSIWSGVAAGVEVPSERAIDIDSPMDFAIARFLMEEWDSNPSPNP